MEREEFFRLKKVQDKKERDLEKKKREKEELAKKKAAAGGPAPPPTAPAVASALPVGDADLVF